MWGLFTTYRGCFYPVLAILALLLVLTGLSSIAGFDSAVLPRPRLNPIENYPQGLSLHEAALVAGSGMKWLMFTYFHWIVGLAVLGFCWFQLQKALTDVAAAQRRTISGIYLGALAITVIALVYTTVVRNTPLMSFKFLLDNLELITTDLVQLATYNTALGYTAVIAMLVTTSLLLVPTVHHREPAQQMRAITRIMYCGAAFLLIWIAQATEMYRLAAMLLIAEQRQEALDFAPTISLMAGVFASLLLAAAYLAAYLWLQGAHTRSRADSVAADKGADDQSPKAFLLAHWPKITAVLMPVLPGVIGQLLQGVGQIV